MSEVVKQHWRGWVDDVDEETFCARLEVVVGEGQEIYACFDRLRLSEKDRTNLTLGRYIEWRIGYRTDEKGTTRKFSDLHLIYLPSFTAEEIEAAKAKAAEWMELFEVSI